MQFEPKKKKKKEEVKRTVSCFFEIVRLCLVRLIRLTVISMSERLLQNPSLCSFWKTNDSLKTEAKCPWNDAASLTKGPNTSVKRNCAALQFMKLWIGPPAGNAYLHSCEAHLKYRLEITDNGDERPVCGICCCCWVSLKPCDCQDSPTKQILGGYRVWYKENTIFYN